MESLFVTRSQEGSMQLKVSRPHQTILRMVPAQSLSATPGTEPETLGSAVSLEGIIRIIYRQKVRSAHTGEVIALAGTVKTFQSNFWVCERFPFTISTQFLLSCHSFLLMCCKWRADFIAHAVTLTVFSVANRAAGLEVAIAFLINVSSYISRHPQSSDVFTRQSHNDSPNDSLKTARNGHLGISPPLEMLFSSAVTGWSSRVLGVLQPFRIGRASSSTSSSQTLGNGDQLGTVKKRLYSESRGLWEWSPHPWQERSAYRGELVQFPKNCSFRFKP